MWKLLNRENAIEGVSASIRFSEPVSSMVLGKLIRHVEPLAKAEGFIDKEPVQIVQFQISNSGPDIRPAASGGVALQQRSVDRDVTGNVGIRLKRQLICQADSLHLQLLVYTDWETEWKRVRRLLIEALNIACGVVPVAALRLEYVNRFIFDAQPEMAKAADLLNPSKMVAPHIFEAENLWHSHTGRFGAVENQRRLLTQVNADMQSLESPHPDAGRRTVVLMLAKELQFLGPGIEIEETGVSDFADHNFNDLHTQIKHLFTELLNPGFVKQSGLA